MLLMISAMRCSFCRILTASWSGGRCVMSSLARGFLRSRLQPIARAVQRRALSTRVRFLRVYSTRRCTAANSSNWMGAVLV